MNFTKKDEYGLEKEYYIVSTYNYNNEELIIYTDLVSPSFASIRLFVGRYEKDQVTQVEYNLEREVLAKFRQEKAKFQAQIEEYIK